MNEFRKPNRDQPRRNPALARAFTLHQAGRLDEAIPAYREAIAAAPDAAEAYLNLGGLLAERRQHRAALPFLQKALALRPDLPEAQNNLGVALMATDQPDAALAAFDAAVALRPGFADAHGNRGSALISIGRIQAAAEAFRTAIALEPQNGQFRLDLARSRRFAAGDPDLVAMQALAARPDALTAESRVALHFALAKALADTGDLAASFRELRQGNALKRVNTPYDEAQTLAVMDGIARAFPADLLARRAGAGEPSPRPVFVVGMPRSGTTLVEQILGGHPAVFAAGERAELHQTAMRAAPAGTRPSALFGALAALSDAGLRRLGAAYLDATTELAPEATRIVDKMPGNFLHAGLIALALPGARIIHVRRDPVDTCLSCYATLFAGQQPFAYNLAELGRYWRHYDSLVRHWHAVLPAGTLLEVHYENVVADLEGEAHRMVAHIGLEWDPRCLDFSAGGRTVRTASRVQVRQGLYRTAVGRAAAYGDLLAPLREALG